MAITNAQQYKQLVNPPLDGKRPGYRGDAAARSTGAAQSGRADPGPRGDPGEGANRAGFSAPTKGESAFTSPDRFVEIKDDQIDAAKDFRELQQFKKNLNKPNFVPSFTASMLTKVFPGNVDYRKEFLAKNPQLLEYFNSLSEEDQKSNATMVALADIMNLDGKTYEDFLAYDKGSPGLKYKGNVGNLEKFVSSYEMNPDGTFKLSPKGYKIPKTYDYRERPDDDGGGDGIMSDYERRLLELEQQLKNQQAAAAAPTTGGPVAYRFFADGGSTGGIMDADIVGGMMDGNMDEMGRQMYGLGKLVKKVTRGVKKIVKSPLGKAALLASPFLFKSGAIGSFFGKGSFNPLKALVSSEGFTGLGPSKFAQFLGKYGLADVSKMALTPKGLMAGIGAVSALPLIFQGDEEEEDYDPYRGPDIDIAKIRSDPYAAMGQAYRFAADGGIMRQNYDEAGAVMSKEEMKKLSKSPLYKGFKLMYGVDPQQAKDNDSYKDKFSQFEQLYKKGYQEGGDVEPVAKKTMPLIDMDGKEKDYRETGGFVDMGRMERADDVPARLSKNEFVFTADAVRNAGEGDIDKGAEVMYNMMKNLEAGGEVSEESQGLEGARNMFQTSQRLGEVI